MEYTRQQMCGAKDFNMRTFTGNWNEDVAREADRMREFMHKRATGTLASQRIQQKMQSHLQQLTLTPQHKDKCLRFNDVVCIQSALTRGFVSVDHHMQSPGRPGHYEITLADSKVPVLRNAWVVKPWKDVNKEFYKSQKEGDIVHYGQQIRLVNPHLSPCHLRLCCDPQVTLKGNCHGRARSEVTACEGGNLETVWTIQPAAGKWTMEQEGLPVETGVPIVIKAVKAARPLCAEERRRTQTSFGDEAEIAVYQQKDQIKKHSGTPNEPANIFAFVCAPTGSKFVPFKRANDEDALTRVKKKILQRGGSSGFRGLVRTLKILDDNGDRKLSRREMKEGMQTYGVHLDAAELDHVFDAFDRDGDGFITITEFLRTLRGEMNKRRTDMVMMAYERLDKNCDGTVTFKEIRSIYEAGTKDHPAVLDGSKTPEEVMMEFIANSWDKNGDGTITAKEFKDYYNDISVNIDNDDYFELMIRNVWHISGGEGWCANTSCRRVLVIHMDCSQTVEEIKDDLGIGPNDLDKMRENLEAQGINDIKEIQLTF